MIWFESDLSPVSSWAKVHVKSHLNLVTYICRIDALSLWTHHNIYLVVYSDSRQVEKVRESQTSRKLKILYVIIYPMRYSLINCVMKRTNRSRCIETAWKYYPLCHKCRYSIIEIRHLYNCESTYIWRTHSFSCRILNLAN